MSKAAPHTDLGDLNLIRSPINLSSFPHPARFDRAAPDPGQDTSEILAGFGLGESEISELREAGAVI